MYGYIYITTDLETGIKYIGKHKATKFEFDKYKGSGVDVGKIQQASQKRRLKTELLESINGVPTICESLEELNSSEAYYVDYYNCVASPDYYNRVPGGIGGYVYVNLTLEQQKKRDKTIGEKSTAWWANASQDVIDARTEKWRKTFFNKTDEEKHELTNRQIRYNASLTLEERAEKNGVLREAAQRRLANPETEAKRKAKEKETKAKQTTEQKSEYTRKQRLAQTGLRYHTTNGVDAIKCRPEDAPDGFYPGGAHRNNYRHICIYKGKTYFDLSAMVEYLQANGYPRINGDKLLDVVKKGKLGRQKVYSPLVTEVQIYGRYEYGSKYS